MDRNHWISYFISKDCRLHGETLTGKIIEVSKFLEGHNHRVYTAKKSNVDFGHEFYGNSLGTCNV